MLKIFGSLMTVGGASLLGCCLAMDLEHSYREMQYLHRLVEMLLGEIRYSRSLLSQIFRKLSGKVKAPYTMWLVRMSDRMEARETGNLAVIWREETRRYLADTALPADQRKQLEELGGLLGDVDMEMQTRHLSGYLEQLQRAMEDMKMEMDNKKKLCRCVGVTVGILIAVLLI